jgi:hypothetical protein
MKTIVFILSGLFTSFLQPASDALWPEKEPFSVLKEDCRDCLMHVGTRVDANNRVKDKNYQFPLPADGRPLKIYVNLFDVNDKPFQAKKFRVVVTVQDFKFNDLGILDEMMIDVKPGSSFFYFNFDVAEQAVYRIEITDENGDFVSAMPVVVYKA